jgi:methyl-accepting chemotaxis protein
MMQMFKHASLRLRLMSTFAIMILLMIAIGSFALWELKKTEAYLDEMYEEAVVAQGLVTEIRSRVGENRTQIALAIQHDPSAEFSNQHNHPLSMHLDRIEANNKAIDESVSKLGAMETLTEEHRIILQKTAAASGQFAVEGLIPAVEALKMGEYGAATMQLLQLMNPLYNNVDASISEFQKGILQRGLDLRNEAAANYRLTLLITGILVALAIASAIIANIILMRVIVQPLGRARQVFDGIARGNYRNDIHIEHKDEIGTVLESLKSMQARLEHDVMEAKRVSDENMRIRQALDSVSGNVRIADKDGRVFYVNRALAATLKRNEAAIRKTIPGFSAEGIVGSSIGAFYPDPQAAITRLANLRDTVRSELMIGDRLYALTTSPIINEAGVNLGSVGEWRDRTDEVASENEVARLVQAAASGDFSERISLDGKEGFFKQLAVGINQVVEASEKGLADVGEVLKALAEGDLTRQMQGNYQGMFAELRNNANATVTKLQEIIGQIRESTDAINTAAREIASGNVDLSSRTENQASSLEETASSMDELTSTVKQNAENSRQANQLAKGASDIAVKGGEIVGQVVQTMGAIADSSKKIADIISVIDGIAFQTNILALNAAVEAARAGEQGRGFAVVAGEVRNLAQRSAAAAKEIKALISDSVGKVDNGYTQVESAGQTMQEIVEAVKRVTDIMGEISAASAEQSQGITQVNASVTQMDEMTQQNAALVEEAAAAAESLQDQANSLSEAGSVFRVQGGGTRLAVVSKANPSAVMARTAPAQADGVDYDAVIKAHQDWKKKQRLASNDPSEATKLDPAVICLDDKCALGQWIHGAGQTCCGSHPDFTHLKGKHAEFHRCASEVAEKARSGDIAAAKQVLHGRFSVLSDETIELIKRMRESRKNAKTTALPAPRSNADGEWQEF